MRLSERMAAIAAEAKGIRESLVIQDPRSRSYNENVGISPSDRLVAGRGVEFQRRVSECGKLMAEVYGGSRPTYHLREAMTTSDFPNLFGDLLYRQLLGNYTPYPVTYPNWTRIVEVNDFRKLHLYAIDGGQGLLTAVKEREPYPEVVFKESAYTVQVAKYGRRYGISFEMVINDDLNAFQQRPALMATGARRSEEWLASTMLAASTGPHATFFSVANKNIVTNNPALSIQGLQTAWSVLAKQLDADGQPIVIDAVSLVVPPALKITAENILHALQLRINSNTGVPAGNNNGGGNIDQFLYTENWMKGKVQLNVNPYLNYINTTSGDTAWYLIANPNDMTTRPAIVFAFMRGRRNPQLFLKDPDQRPLGGGDPSPMDGNFDSDSIDYKLRHMFGAAQIDPKMAVSSDGTGG